MRKRKNQIYAKFIGRDGSMGLRNGRIYKIKITIEQEMVIVKCRYGWRCPYSSVVAFLNNWEMVR